LCERAERLVEVEDEIEIEVLGFIRITRDQDLGEVSTLVSRKPDGETRDFERGIDGDAEGAPGVGGDSHGLGALGHCAV
jgi:hypothetical protein